MSKKSATHSRIAPSDANPADVSVHASACTAASVRRLSRRITAFYEQHMQQSGLKLSQYSVLAHLSREPQSLQQLAARLEMDRTTLTRGLRALAASGWVSEVDGEDARQRLLVLTATGERFRKQARTSWKAAQSALEQHLGPGLISNLHAQLDNALLQLKRATHKES